MKVDVIIPIYHPGKTLIQLIQCLEGQTVPIEHFILMHTCEKADDDQEILAVIQKNQKVEIYPVPKAEFDHGRCRNAGASHSKADVCVFMTQDAVPRDGNLIENLLQGLNGDTVACAYARQLPKEGSTEVERLTRQFNYPDRDQLKGKKDLPYMGIKTYFCSNVCCAYNMEIFHKLGGFINRTIFNEDMIYAGTAVQNGYCISYVSRACVIHSHNYTGKQQLKRNFDLGVSQAEHPEIFDGISSEKEGVKMVKKVLGLLKKSGKYKEILPYIYQTACKYIGFRLGKMYKKLPACIIQTCTMSPLYFKKWNKQDII